MLDQQIYKAISFSQDCMGRNEFLTGQATYLVDPLAVARTLKLPSTRVFLYPQGTEVTEAKLELILKNQSNEPV